MLVVEPAIERLRTLVPDLLRSVGGAADMMALMKTSALPQNTPAAHVVPAGMRGADQVDAAGLFIQNLEETLGVVITLRTNDATGRRGLDQMQAIISAVITRICGWGPDDAPGEFRLLRGSVAKMDAEAFVYLLEFAIPMQLRLP